jgi:7-cyano-7-deazaguanine synthase
MMKLLEKEGHEIYPLFINYGQLSVKKELASYKKICETLGLKAEIFDINGFGKKIISGITDESVDPKEAFLPNRNLLFLILASSYAYQNDIFNVAIGLIKPPIFPDQTIDFVNVAEDCIEEALSVDMNVIAPLIELDKTDVYKLAMEEKLPLDITYYCHVGTTNPCGKCLACQEHVRTKKALGIEEK